MAIKTIRQHIKIVQSRKKKKKKRYTDSRHMPLEFVVGDSIFIKVAPMKAIMRFGKKGKLSPRYVGPYEIIR